MLRELYDVKDEKTKEKKEETNLVDGYSLNNQVTIINSSLIIDGGMEWNCRNCRSLHICEEISFTDNVCCFFPFR